MSLWVDKYRPLTLEKMTYHTELSTNLSKLAESGDLPHMLFYGPSGAGKKTRIMALLRAIYGAGVEKVKLEHRNFKTPSKKIIELTTMGSNYHIEMNPSDVGIYDTVVVQEVIKEIAQYSPLETSSQKSFKVVVLMEVDKLSRNAQAALRRTMEKYTRSCRLILCCESASKVLGAVRSRCLGVRVAAPTPEEIVDAMNLVARKEGCKLPEELAARVATASGRNLRRALLMLEACKAETYPLEPAQPIALTDWELFIGEIASDILQEQSPARLLIVRGKLYELLTNCIPANVILKTLVAELLPKLDTSVKHEFSHWAAYYEARMQRGSKEIFHLEAFVAKLMMVYKKFLLTGFE